MLSFFRALCFILTLTQTLHLVRLEAARYVFHSSPEKGLKTLHPAVAAHGQKWVYASPRIGISSAYLSRGWDDFDLAQGVCGQPQQVYLAERYKGAFEKIYGSSVGASVYKLDAVLFLKGQTGFDQEVVSPNPVPVLEEQAVPAPMAFLQELAERGELQLYWYPKRPACVPSDDADLITKAATLIRAGSSGVRVNFAEKHPALQRRLELILGQASVLAVSP